MTEKYQDELNKMFNEATQNAWDSYEQQAGQIVHDVFVALMSSAAKMQIQGTSRKNFYALCRTAWKASENNIKPLLPELEQQ